MHRVAHLYDETDNSLVHLNESALRLLLNATLLALT